MRPRYARGVFATAAVFNILVGTTAVVAPCFTARLLGISRCPVPVLMELIGWLVLVLGVGYGWTARDPERNRDLMRMGALGKAGVLPLMLLAWWRGDVGLVGVLAGAGDLVFAALFVDVLRRMR